MSKSTFFFFILSILGIANVYAALRGYRCLRTLFPRLNGWIFAALSLLFVTAMVTGFLKTFPSLPAGLGRAWKTVSACWLGFLLYLVPALIAADLLLSAAVLLRAVEHPVPEKLRFFSTLAAFLLALLTAGYGVYHADHAKTVSYDIELGEKETAGGLSIVLISDVHLGAVNSERRMERIVQKINALEPDLVCLAGDTFDSNFSSIRDPDRASEMLRGIHAKYGVYACLGNHDAGSTVNEMLEFLEKSNIRLLAEEYEVIDGRFILSGRLDRSPIGGYGGVSRGTISEVLADADPGLPVIVLDHNPAHLDEYGTETDLILSGHTHRGQLFPIGLITRRMYTVDYGYYRKDGESPRMIVTSGVGAWGMPMRVGSDSEVVEITVNRIDEKNYGIMR